MTTASAHTAVLVAPPTGHRLVADIGGTNARFAFSDPDSGALHHIRNLECAGRGNLTELVQDYLRQVGFTAPSRMCVALAGPINGDLCGLTNTPLRFSITRTRAELGLEHLDVINDFAAIALAVPTLTASDTAPLGTVPPRDGLTKAVLGPGTGLGMAGLLPTATGWQVVTGEGGHIPAAPFDDYDSEVIGVLRRAHGSVSAETMVSGPGLVRTHAAVCLLSGHPAEPLTAAQISDRGQRGTDPDCVTTLTLFCQQLATVAATAALTYGALGGVYLAGGIPGRIADFLHSSSFRQRFEHHPQMGGYLSQIATVRITVDNPGLRGAGRHLDR
ncbi:glucokinase [Nakamurella silvestris]|nr:glucokinase [Nakamurella silvestris]